MPCWLQQAIDSAQTHGTLFVASAGNDGDNTDKVQHLPSTISSPIIVAVGATDSYDNFWAQSNFGTKTVQVGMGSELSPPWLLHAPAFVSILCSGHAMPPVRVTVSLTVADSG